MSKKQKTRKPIHTTPAVAAAAPIVNIRAPVSSKANFSQSFNPDYSNVVKDLKRIGMLAGSFFVILIILSFILH